MNNFSLNEKERKEQIIDLFSRINDPMIRSIILNSVPLDILLEIGLELSSSDIGCITTYEKNEIIPEIIFNRLKNEKEFIKANCDRIVKLKYCNIRILAIPYLRLESVIEVGLNETNDIIAEEIIYILSAPRRYTEDIVRNNAHKLIRAKNPKIRSFAAKLVPIETIKEMAMFEIDSPTVNVIYSRLSSELNSDEINYNDLVNAVSSKIKSLCINKFTLNELIDYSIKYIPDNISSLVVSRLNEFMDEDELKKNSKKFIKAQNSRVRKFAVDYLLDISDVIKMAVYEEDEDIIFSIIDRLNLEKDSDIIKKEFCNLIYAKDFRIREFIVDLVPINLLFDMALIDNFCYVTDAIIKRLSLKENEDILKNNAYKLAKSSDCQIVLLSIDFMSLDELFSIATNEICNNFVLDKIIQRLKNEENDNFDLIKANSYKLSNSKNIEIRLYASKFLSFVDIVNIEARKCDKEIAQIIMDRLN